MYSLVQGFVAYRYDSFEILYANYVYNLVTCEDSLESKEEGKDQETNEKSVKNTRKHQIQES